MGSSTTPLESLRQVLDSGDVLELIKVLEAHLKQNPKDAAGWRALGQVQRGLGGRLPEWRDEEETALVRNRTGERR